MLSERSPRRFVFLGGTPGPMALRARRLRLRLQRKKNSAAITAAMNATPPTTPPAIAPAFEREDDEAPPEPVSFADEGVALAAAVLVALAEGAGVDDVGEDEGDEAAKHGKVAVPFATKNGCDCD